jgi:hypothetical protein
MPEGDLENLHDYRPYSPFVKDRSINKLLSKTAGHFVALFSR